MKYLKKFENEDKLPELKKYLIWKNGQNNTCSILENTNKIVITDTGNTGELRYKILKVKHLYNYNFNKNKLISRDNIIGGKTSGLIYDQLEDSIEKYLIYQSDDLQDCIDTVEIMSIAKKYNIG